MDILQAIIIAIVEGITEFLPISSTGHMIITQKILGIESSEFVKVFTVNIQFGAILSVIVLYYKKFFQSIKFYMQLLIAFIPAAIAGFLLGNKIDELLESVEVVAISLILGGIILLFVDKWLNRPDATPQITYGKALKIGLFQCLALIPGISRSAASIVGGLTQKLDKKTATEFSFFLAVPTMFAASAYKLLKTYKTIDNTQINTLLLGNVIAFIVAMLAIKFFITFVTRYGFKIFGYYRIAVGTLILLLLLLGYNLNIA
jgi:undecaprenyl-diphosphatase